MVLSYLGRRTYHIFPIFTMVNVPQLEIEKLFVWIGKVMESSSLIIKLINCADDVKSRFNFLSILYYIISIFAITGIQHKVNVKFCQCEEEFIALLRFGFWGATPQRRELAFHLYFIR